MKVIIAHTETRGPLGDSHLGEVRMGTPPLAGPVYAAVLQLSLRGPRRGTVCLKERILCSLGLSCDLFQAPYPHPTVCCRVLGHTVPGTCDD